MKPYYRLIGLLPVPLLLLSQAMAAPTAIEIDTDTPAFQSRQIQSGPIALTASYTPHKPGADDSALNLRYQIAYNGVTKVTDSDDTYYHAKLSLQDLDGDRQAEVLVETFTGGAHCCTNIKVYAWQNGQFRQTATGLRDGMGGSFSDLDGNGTVEFATVDNAFLYAFGSYAGSYPPSQIYAFRQGQFQLVTRQYPKVLRATLQDMYKAIKERQQESGEINGVLAGYVAQKILLGEYQQGWNFMLAHYDRTSDWGLAKLNADGQEIGRYPNYPAALKALLIEQGYLNAQGQPK